MNENYNLTSDILEDETVVDIDGVSAEITSLTESEITIAAPSQRVEDGCSGFGERGFLAKVWDHSASNVWEPLFSDPDTFEINQALFEQKGKWTAHLEGYFRPPSDGYYSFLVAANHEGRLFFSTSGCSNDASLGIETP